VKQRCNENVIAVYEYPTDYSFGELAELERVQLTMNEAVNTSSIVITL
jgi:hypothetical protein